MHSYANLQYANQVYLDSTLSFAPLHEKIHEFRLRDANWVSWEKATSFQTFRPSAINPVPDTDIGYGGKL